MKKDITLVIRGFSSDLADHCCSVTGEKTLTKSVLKILDEYFLLKKEVSRLRLKVKDLEMDLSDCMDFFELENKVVARKVQLLSLLSDPNRFRLHGD